MVSRVRFRIDASITVFLALYLLRLVYDLGRPDLFTTGDDLAFYVSTVLIPVAGVIMLAGDWSWRACAWLMAALGAVVCLAALALQFSGAAAERSLTDLTGRLRFDTINPITFGHAGVTVLLAAFCLWARASTTQRVLLALGCVVAAAVLVMANSRSPYLSLAAALGVIMLARRRWAWLGLIAAAAVAVWVAFDIGGALAGSRLTTIDDPSALERLVIQRDALAAFSEHPFLGAGYLDPATQMYPHNLFIESAMALGVGGFALYSWISLVAIRRSIRVIIAGDGFLAAIFWQFFVVGQLSSTFFGAGALFMAMILLSEKGRAPARPAQAWA
jgi:O-antigen ligase